MYLIDVKPKVRKEIRLLPVHDQERVLTAFSLLQQDPFLGKRLEGQWKEARVVRVWPYRIVYLVHEKIVTIEILRVAHRQGVYKK
jgi:mRNA interferase RelE/StbE